MWDDDRDDTANPAMAMPRNHHPRCHATRTSSSATDEYRGSDLGDNGMHGMSPLTWDHGVILIALIFLPGDDAEAVNKEGFLNDVQIQSIDDTTQKHHTDKTVDMNAFFDKPHMVKSKDGKSRNVWDCEVCWYVWFMPAIM